MAALTDVIGLGVLLKWKDQATGNIKKTEKAVDQLGDSIDETEKRTAKLQAGFSKLAKAGAGITAFGVAGAATLFGISKAAGIALSMT